MTKMILILQNIMLRINKAFNFFRAKWIWYKPLKVEILIYDYSGFSLIKDYIKSFNYDYIYTRSEQINIPIFLISLLNSFFSGINLKQIYLDSLIEIIQPKIIITCVDNNINFYSISHRFPHIKFIFIQNGTRNAKGDIFEILKKNKQFKVDYMFVHGKAIGEYYSRFIKGKYIPVGSFLSNKFPKQYNKTRKKNILFISQYINDEISKKCEITYINETRLLSFLMEWCTENNEYLYVLGRTGSNEEEKYFRAHLGDCKWKFLYSKNKNLSYKAIDNSKVVVCVDSTLGFESLSRGNKTLFFTFKNFDKLGSAKFGWPLKFPESGLFWSNTLTHEIFNKKMTFIYHMSSDKWNHFTKNKFDDLMILDRNNSKFNKLIKNLVT